MIVQITEFQLPNGKQVQQETTLKDECQENYNLLIKLGLRLTAEILITGVVSQTIESPNFDFDMELTSGNDLTENKHALEKMILRFTENAYLEMKKDYDN